MSEEKKEEKQEAPKQETPKQEPAPQAAAPKQEAPKAEEKKVEEKKKEKPANCAICNKSIKKKRYYYRNGKYYCTKRCFKTTIKKDSKESAQAPAEPEAQK